jgi:transposase-like protein
MAQQVTILTIAERIPDEAAAYEFLEELRWGGKPVCPHCGNRERCYFLTPKNVEGRKTNRGKVSARRVWKCGVCRKQFSVLTGTIFHGTKIPVRTWVFVIFEMCSSKNGVAAREIERKYGLTPKTAWFMTQRIREAMKREPLAGLLTGTIVADETWIGGSAKNKPKSVRNARHPQPVGDPTRPVALVAGKRQSFRGDWQDGKTAVLSLIDIATGEVRSKVVPDVTGATLRKAIAEQVDLGSTILYTDESRSYMPISHELAGHETVNHSADEYVRYTEAGPVTTNQAEGFFSQLKRSIDGTHHHVSAEHLHRYLAEFDFRYTTRKESDTDRMRMLVDRVDGRRLTYRPLRSGE